MKKTSMEEQVLRASKEIVVKFIEVGRISPSNFPDTFAAIYHAVDATVRSRVAETASEEDE